MVEGLTAWVTAAGADADVRVVVITGAGRAFCSGDDIVGGMDDRSNDVAAMRARIMDTTRRRPHDELVRTLLATRSSGCSPLVGDELRQRFPFSPARNTQGGEAPRQVPPEPGSDRCRTS